MSDLVPAEAVEAVIAAWPTAWMSDKSFAGKIEVLVEAAAPLILAGELERLLDEAFPNGEASDYHYALEALFEAIQNRASALRGEVQSDVQ